MASWGMAITLIAGAWAGHATAAICVWNGGDASWNDPLQWTDCDGGVPGVADTVVIGDGIATLAGPLTIAGLTMSGGMINGTGSLTVTDDLLLTGDTKIIAGITLVNAGAGLWEAGDFGLGPHPNPRGHFVNQSGAIFEIAGDVDTLSANGSTFTNHGTLRKIGPGSSGIRSTAVINVGLLEVLDGTLAISGNSGDPHSGTFEIAADTLLQFWESQRFGPSSSITGSGNVSFRNISSANWVSWTLDNGATFDIGGRTRLGCPQCFVNFNSNQASTGDLLLDGVNVGTGIEGRANGSLTVNGLFDWRSGRVGTTISNNTQVFTVHALGGIALDQGRSTINRDGLVINHGSAVYSGGQFYLEHPSARFHNLPGASFELRGALDLSHRQSAQSPPLGRLVNEGSFLKTGEGEATITGVWLENSGLLEVQEGSLSFVRHPGVSQGWQGGRLVMNDGVVQSQTPLSFEQGRLYGRGVINADVTIDNAIFLGSGSEPDGSDYEAGILQINGALTLDDEHSIYVRLVNPDPQAGVGYTQLQLSNTTELRGRVVVQIRDTFVDQIQVGDEFVALTCAQGCTRFFEQVNVSVPANSGLFFEALYQGNQVVLRVLEAEPEPVDPPSGLTANNDGPVYEGQTVNLSASVSAGQNPFYFWSLGDGATATGSHIEHVYDSPGSYIASVEVANPGGSVSTTVSVEVLERPNFAGRVWLDRDADGQQADDEPWLSGATVSAVGPGGNLSDLSGTDGRWRIATDVQGWYQLAVGLAGYAATTGSPLQVPLPSSGSALNDFGLIETPAPGQARIVGRSFVSLGQGLVDVGQQGLEGRPISLWQDGVEIASTLSTLGGLYSFDDLAPGSYELRAPAPPGHFPAQLLIDGIELAPDQVLGVSLAFVEGGQLSGRVCSAAGAVAGADSLCQPQGNGVADVQISLLQASSGAQIDRVVSASNGSYQFGALVPGEYVVQIIPPEGWFTDDGVLERVIGISGGSHSTDWVLHRLGRLDLRVNSQSLAGATVPIGGVRFEFVAPNGDLSAHFSGADGRILLDDLEAGTWVARPDPTSLPADSVIAPGQRSLTVANNTGALGVFTVESARSVRARCIAGASNGGGSAFACRVEARVIEDELGNPRGTLVYSANDVVGTHLVLGLASGSYEIHLIPDNAAWPEYSEAVVLSDNTHAVVDYPYNPSPANADIRGYVFHDLNSNGVRQCALGECVDADADGITVRLFDADGGLLATTQTETVTVNNPSQPVITGYFRFPGLTPGDYEVRADLPPGFAPRGLQNHSRTVTLLGNLNEITIGYRRAGETQITGRVFIDQAGDGSYNPTQDNPVGAATIRLLDPSGVQLDERQTSSNGSYLFTGLLPGAYQVVLIDPPSGHSTLLQQTVTLPFNQASAQVNFPLVVADGLPRVLLFLDGNGNGSPDSNEQRLAGVQVQVFDAPCHAASSPSFTLTSNVDGIAAAAIALNQFVGCARAINLPPGLAAVQANGVGILKNAPPAWLPLQSLGQLRVEPFLDFNGNGVRNAGEPIVQSVTVNAGGQSQSTGPDGASFFLTAGSAYPVSLSTGSLWQVAADQPLSVYVGTNQPALLRVPLVYAAGVQGQVLFNGNGAAWTGGSVELVNLGTGAVVSQTLSGQCPSSPCPAAGSFRFPALPPGNYQLRLASTPAGYLLAEEPLIPIGPGSSEVRNLFLIEAGQISGLVYSDSNFNGRLDSGEPGSGTFPLRLVNDSGLPVRTIQPSGNGQFNIGDLSAGVRYALTIDETSTGPTGTAITDSPGWFSIGSQPQTLRVGLASIPLLQGLGSRNRFHGQVYLGPWHSRIPVAGARVVSYFWNPSHPAADGCNQVDPVITGEGFTDVGGHFHVFAGPPSLNLWQCLKVVDTPGIAQNQAAIVKSWGGYPSPSGFVLRAGTREQDIQVVVSANPVRAQGAGGELRFSAFRDDNGNALREASESMLGGVGVSLAGFSAVTGNNGGGLLANVPTGLHQLTISAPEGYRVVGPNSRAIWIGDQPLELPPIALRPDFATLIQIFEDWDGDGRQAGDEYGIGQVVVQLEGPVNRTESAGPSGRLLIDDLPDGNYTVSVTTPAGFAPIDPLGLVVDGSGMLSVPLQPSGMISGVAYADQDGDGRRLADEPLLQSLFTVRLDGNVETELVGGRFAFTDAAPGLRTIDALWSGIEPLSLEIDSGSGNGVALPQASPGTVRGVLWLDLDGDGLRQPWELPLAGVEVTLQGVGNSVTDQHGRYLFLGVAPGTYPLDIDLPEVLSADPPVVLVGSDRGAVAGVPIGTDRIFYSGFESEFAPTSVRGDLMLVHGGGGRSSPGDLRTAPIHEADAETSLFIESPPISPSRIDNGELPGNLDDMASAAADLPAGSPPDQNVHAIPGLQRYGLVLLALLLGLMALPRLHR